MDFDIFIFLSVSLTPPNDIQVNGANIRPPIPVPSLLSSQSRISPPATIITANIPSEQPTVLSTSSDALSVMSQVLQDPDGNPPVIITAGATTVTRSSNIELSLTLFIQSRDPA